MTSGLQPFSVQTAAAASLPGDCLSATAEREEKRGSDHRAVLLKIASGFMPQHTELAFAWI